MDWSPAGVTGSILPDKFSTFGKIRERFGWLATLEVASLWVLRRTIGYREAAVYRLDLKSLSSSDPDGLDWGYKAPREINGEIVTAAGLDSIWLEEAGARGDRCFAGTADGIVCYISVVSPNGFRVPERLALRFTASSESYVGNCYTLERYRGRGFYPRALMQVGSALRSEGVERLYLFVERENLASRRSIEKAGFRSVATCRVFRWRQAARRSWRVLAPMPHCEVELITDQRR